MRKEIFNALSFDKKTGQFCWLKTSGKAIKGSFAGAIHTNGYIKIGYKGKRYYAHRLAWEIYYGDEPADMIDHINGNRTDNRIENLRLANSLKNSQNIRFPHCDNKSGLLGVFRQRKKFSAQICTNGVKICLGTFETAQEAHNAYIQAKRNFHDFCTI